MQYNEGVAITHGISNALGAPSACDSLKRRVRLCRLCSKLGGLVCLFLVILTIMRRDTFVTTSGIVSWECFHWLWELCSETWKSLSQHRTPCWANCKVRAYRNVCVDACTLCTPCRLVWVRKQTWASFVTMYMWGAYVALGKELCFEHYGFASSAQSWRMHCFLVTMIQSTFVLTYLQSSMLGCKIVHANLDEHMLAFLCVHCVSLKG